MRRRELITLLGGAATCWSLTTRAEVPATDRPLVAYLAGGTHWNAAQFIGFLQEGLQELGYSDGRNFDFVVRYADGYTERLPSLAEELVQLRPKVLVAGAGSIALALRKVTHTIPIVCPAFDAERLGLVASFARPGGNVTGITPYVVGMLAKQMELAREVFPGAGKIGVLGDINAADVPSQRRELEEAGKALDVKVVMPDVRSPDDLAGAIQVLVREPVDVVIALYSVLIMSERRQIVRLMAANRLPAVYPYREFVDAGGLISYGIDLHWSFRRAATFIDKILKGAAPGDLPVEFPTKLELVINLKAAKALGITIAPLLFARADEVIE